MLKPQKRKREIKQVTIRVSLADLGEITFLLGIYATKTKDNERLYYYLKRKHEAATKNNRPFYQRRARKRLAKLKAVTMEGD